MKRFFWAIFSVFIIVVSSILPSPFTEAVQAETGQSPLEELVNGAESIVVGTVVERNSYWNDEHTKIYTSVVLSVEERLKGTASQDRITVTFLGGEVDEIGEWVSDMPSFDQGERALVFLKKLSKAQLPEEQFEVYGGFRGKFTITGDKVGNLPLAQFKERVSNVLKGQTLADWELDVPLSVATSPYSYSGLSWPHPPAPVVNYRINENCADCTGEGVEVQAAAATWNAAGAQFSFSYAGTTTATTASYDGVNEIMWRNFGSGGTIALTTTWYYTSNNNIVECDMEFNDYYTFSTAATPPSSQYDVQTIALHEFGHFLMLDDLYNAADSAKVMYGYGSPGTTKRALHADDIAGIRYIYGVSPTPPNAPSNLTANAISSSQINLSWQDNSSNETGFKIERKTGSGSYSQIATAGAGVTGYSNNGLSAGTTYYYRVRAYSAAGDSAYSNEASATTLPPPPSAPTLKSPASASTVPTLTPRLEWNASTGATDYGLQISTSSGFTNLIVNEAGITDLFYDVCEGILNWNTTYYWRVNAKNSFGSTSSWSSSRYFKTAVGPPPNAPSDLIATPISSSQINLSWQDNSDNETGFKIERKTGSGSYSQIATVGAGVTSYSNSRLSASTEYYYRVWAYSAAGNSDYSNEASATTLPPPPPAPTLKSPARASTVPSLMPRLEWNASSGAVSYGVQIATTSRFTNLIVNETGITALFYDVSEGTLNWNTTYYWRVNARNSFNSTSSWSSYRYFKTAVGPPPNAPSDLIATPISSSQINLTWQDNSDNETGFKIERKTGSGSYSQIATVGTGVTSYSNSRLSASTTYYYRVRAYNGTLNSDYCEEASATTLPPPPPAPVLKSPAGGSTVPTLTPRLEWNTSAGATDYGLQVATTSSFTTLLVNETGITNLYYDIAPWILKWNTTYYWRVNARNSFGSTSSWSTSRYFKTTGTPGPFTLTISSTAGGSVTIPGEGTFTYNAGTVVSLVATPASGYHFANWTGDVGTIANVNAASTNITMNGAYSITANFFQGQLIRTWYDLDDIRDNLGGSYILMNDLDSTTPGYTELASEAANGGKGWEPIGPSGNPFTGTFNGQGCEIRDLFINRPDESDVGLFGVVYEGGVIKNIGVNATVTGDARVGGLVGECYGTVNSSYSTGSVTGGGFVGGLVGDNDGTVSNSYSTGSVTGTRIVGGLVGINYVGAVVSNSYYNYDEVLINGENIISTGALFDKDFEEWLANGKFLDVNDRLSQENGYYVVNNFSDFKELLAFGQDNSLKFRLNNDLNLATEPDFYIPYLAGEFDGNGHKISNLSFKFDFISQVGLFGHLAPSGKVTQVGVENVNITGDWFVGGLVGKNEDGTVSDCYSTGSVSGGYYSSFVGGLVGHNWHGTVSDCYSTGSVTGGGFVGGLVGDNDGTVSNSYATGSVTGNERVGGLVGAIVMGTISNSYSTGNVTGYEYVGGLVGWSQQGTVSNSYSTGNVTGNEDVGGLVGYKWEGTGTVSNSFWDTETSGQATSDGGTGKTTVEMQNIATFSGAGWNITAVAFNETNPAYIWNIVDNVTYPFLSANI